VPVTQCEERICHHGDAETTSGLLALDTASDRWLTARSIGLSPLVGCRFAHAVLVVSVSYQNSVRSLRVAALFTASSIATATRACSIPIRLTSLCPPT
jgi:hypothetical protein